MVLLTSVAEAFLLLSSMNTDGDLIDLAVLRLQCPIPQSSIEKAEKAYEVIRPLKKAIESFQKRPDYRQKCFNKLQVDEFKISKIIDGVDLLSKDFGLFDTERVFQEKKDIFADSDKQEESY
jgi:hypothetical protein